MVLEVVAVTVAMWPCGMGCCWVRHRDGLWGRAGRGGLPKWRRLESVLERRGHVDHRRPGGACSTEQSDERCSFETTLNNP